MSRIKLFGLIVTLTAFAVPVLAAPAAQATHEDDTFGVLSCVFEGLSGQAPAKVSSITSDNGTNGLLDVDPGTFTFSGDASCTGKDTASSDGTASATDAAKRPTLTGVPNNVHIEALGEFRNLVCGTGTAVGTAEFSDNPGSNLDLTGADINGNGTSGLVAPFGITFASGNGKASASDVDGSITDKVSGTPANVVQEGEGSGYVNIIPGAAPAPLGNGNAADGNCINSDVGAFKVRGTFEATVAGDASDDVDP